VPVLGRGVPEHACRRLMCTGAPPGPGAGQVTGRLSGRAHDGLDMRPVSPHPQPDVAYPGAGVDGRSLRARARGRSGSVPAATALRQGRRSYFRLVYLAIETRASFSSCFYDNVWAPADATIVALLAGSTASPLRLAAAQATAAQAAAACQAAKRAFTAQQYAQPREVTQVA